MERCDKLRLGLVSLGGCGALWLGRVCYGWVRHGKAVALRSVMIRLGTAWCGGHGNVCLVETSCVMACSGGRGVSRWGGLASGEAVVVRHESFGPARHGVSWRLILKGGVNE